MSRSLCFFSPTMHAGRYVGDASTALPHALSGPGEVVFVNVTKEEFVSSSGLEQVRSPPTSRTCMTSLSPKHPPPHLSHVHIIAQPVSTPPPPNTSVGIRPLIICVREVQ